MTLSVHRHSTKKVSLIMIVGVWCTGVARIFLLWCTLSLPEMMTTFLVVILTQWSTRIKRRNPIKMRLFRRERVHSRFEGESETIYPINLAPPPNFLLALGCIQSHCTPWLRLWTLMWSDMCWLFQCLRCVVCCPTMIVRHQSSLSSSWCQSICQYQCFSRTRRQWSI